MHKQPKISAEFKDLIPALSPQEYAQLEENILAHGCRDPITLWRGKIIDGHNRYAICTMHKIPFETAKLRLPSKDAVKLWILDNQLGRRNLTDAMRIELAAQKVAILREPGHETTRKAIAREARLSEQTVQRYMTIKTGGDEEMLAKVMSGEYKIGTAFRKAKGGPRQMEITTVTREPMCKGYKGFTPPPKEERFILTRAVARDIRWAEDMFGFLDKRYGFGVHTRLDVCERLELYCRRLVKLMGEVG